jgi:hypothetical protein
VGLDGWRYAVRWAIEGYERMMREARILSPHEKAEREKQLEADNLNWRIKRMTAKKAPI